MHSANALATRPALSAAATVCPTSVTIPKTAAPTIVPPRTPNTILPLRRGIVFVPVLVGWKVEGPRRDERHRRHVHEAELKAGNMVFWFRRRRPRDGIKARMTGEQLSKGERGRELSYRR